MTQKDYRSEGTVQAFPSEIRQLLANLINALDALPEGETIQLCVVDSHDWSKRSGTACALSLLL